MKEKKLYLSCATISIFSFYEILKTNDYRYLIKGYSKEDEDKHIDFKSNKEGEVIFEKILKEFLLLSKEPNSKPDLKEISDFKNNFLITELEYKYTVTTKLLNIYMHTNSLEALLILKEVGWALDTLKPYGPQIDVITKACLGLKNQIKIKKINYSNKNKIKASEEAKTMSLAKQALYLQNNLELGYFLDVRKCTVENWLNLLSFSNEKERYIESNKTK